MKLTTPSVRALKLERGQRDKTFWDDEIGGFGVRVREGGSKVWVVQYDVGGRARRMTLGAIEALDAGKARATAKDVLAAVRLGRDPAAEKHTARVRTSETFGALLPRYLEHQRAKLKPRSFQEVDRHLVLHVHPLHARAVDAIDQRGAAIMLAKIAENNGPAAANRTRASVSAYFSWLMKEGLASSNPFANTNKAAENASRDRTPTDGELAEIWHACEDNQYGAIVRLLMLCGARRDEIAGLRWSEVNVDDALITLPPTRTKGRREHEIPLSAAALAIVEAQPRRDVRDHIFGRGEGGFSDYSSSKSELDARILEARQAAMKKGKAVPMPAWTLHDFRRAMSTTMHERLGVAPHVVEACLGHSGVFRSGVASVYNRASYRIEKKQALGLWGEHLRSVIEGDERKVTFDRVTQPGGLAPSALTV
jgi:integrase